MLREARQLTKHEVRVLVVGSKHAGKTTIMRQLVQLYCGGYPEAERRGYADVIARQLVRDMQLLLRESELAGGYVANRELVRWALGLGDSEPASPDLFRGLHELWPDPGIQTTLQGAQRFTKGVCRSCVPPILCPLCICPLPAIGGRSFVHLLSIAAP